MRAILLPQPSLRSKSCHRNGCSPDVNALRSVGVQSVSTEQLERTAGGRGPIAIPPLIRSGPPPLHGGLLAFLRFAASNHMLSPAMRC